MGPTRAAPGHGRPAPAMPGHASTATAARAWTCTRLPTRSAAVTRAAQRRAHTKRRTGWPSHSQNSSHGAGRRRQRTGRARRGKSSSKRQSGPPAITPVARFFAPAFCLIGFPLRKYLPHGLSYPVNYCIIEPCTKSDASGAPLNQGMDIENGCIWNVWASQWQHRLVSCK